MTILEIQKDFKIQLSNVESKIIQLQQKLQLEQQVCLKLQGAVEALQIAVESIEYAVCPDFVEVAD